MTLQLISKSSLPTFTDHSVVEQNCKITDLFATHLEPYSDSLTIYRQLLTTEVVSWTRFM